MKNLVATVTKVLQAKKRSEERETTSSRDPIVVHAAHCRPCGAFLSDPSWDRVMGWKAAHQAQHNAQGYRQ